MKIDINVPDGISGYWAVETFEVKEMGAGQISSLFRTGRFVPPGTYKRLTYYNSVVMSNTPNEIRDCMRFIRAACGTILINGLGLGVVLKAILEKENIKEITVIEKSEDVIKLVAPTYKDSRLNIIHADAYEYKPPRGKKYDFVWHDIWDDLCTDNLKKMSVLHRKYGKRTKWQDSWSKALCKIYKRRGF